MVQILNPAHGKQNLFFDDQSTSYSNEDNLFSHSSSSEVERVKKSAEGLLGGNQSTSKSSLKWNKKVWRAVKDGFNWLITKIVQLFKFIFGIKSKKKSETNQDPDSNQKPAKKILHRSSSDIDLSDYKKDILCKPKYTESLKKKSKKIDSSLCLDKSKVCVETLKQLIGDLKSESSALKRSVESLDLADLHQKKELQIERKLAHLRYLQTLNFEISEAFSVVEGIVKKNQFLIKNGTELPNEDVLDFKNLQFKLNSIYWDFKKKIYNQSEGILEIFNNLKDTLNVDTLKNRDLWFLRSYLSVLHFVAEHGVKFNQYMIEANVKSFEFLNLEINTDASLKFSVDPNELENLMSVLEHLIEKKLTESKTEPGEILLNKKSEDAPVNHSLGGIPNVGMSCYLNSNLQAILGSSLKDTFELELSKPKRPSKGKDEEGKVFLQRLNRYLKIDLRDWKRAKKLKEAMKAFREIYEIRDLNLRNRSMASATRQIRKAVFDSKLSPNLEIDRIYRQQDAPECMLAFLIALDVKFRLRETTANTEGRAVKSVKEEDSYLLEIPLGKDHTSFQKLIDKYGDKEFVDDPSNQWVKDGKNYSKYNRELKISQEIPDVIVVQLKRMAFSMQTLQKSKVDTSVTWETEEIDLASIIDPELYKNGESTKYTLQAFVNHHGSSPSHGHYTARVRDNDTWYHLDDNDPVATSSKRSEMAAREKGYLYVLKRKKD